ncbi:hypothetical protein CAL7716_056990 [Calothrix sp. PCC 7716]|nr:hypothetical protein CAL7716_056990 [Calothrix sp. PCC 7716]
MPYSIIPAAEIQRRLIENVVGKINLTLQKEIVHDVLDFIQKQRKAWEITNQLFTLAFYCCLDAIKDGVMLGLEGKDGRQLHVIQDGQIGIDLSFWKSPQNQYIINAYCCGTVLTWISIIPYNVVIENMHGAKLTT